MLSEEKAMEILEAYDLTSSLRSAAALCGVDHHTVRRYVAARAAGLDPATTFGRPAICDPFVDKISEWVERSCGAVRADVVHRKLLSMGFCGSERTTRRVVARLKREYVRATHRVYKPWVTEPGMWLQFDYGQGPVVAGRPTTLFCAWLAWSRFRVVLALSDRTFPSLVSALDRTFRAVGGAPTYLLTDNEKTVTTRHVAGLAVRNRETLGVAHYYGVAIHTCVVADPESKGGSESSVKLAKADVLPRPDNLVAAYPDVASLERACAETTERFNTRVHRETGQRPVDRLVTERRALHAIPTEPYSVALGETRTVSWSSLISFGGSRYSVPYQLCEEVVFVRRDGDEVVITATDEGGAREVARHRVAGKGQITLLDAHYPERPVGPERAPKATTSAEAEFLAIGEGSKRYLAEMAATGERHVDERMAEAIALSATTDRGRLDEALGLAALAGRFAAHDLVSILSFRREPRRRIAEGHSLQPGTSGWARLGEQDR
jgi:transposase